MVNELQYDYTGSTNYLEVMDAPGQCTEAGSFNRKAGFFADDGSSRARANRQQSAKELESMLPLSLSDLDSISLQCSGSQGDVEQLRNGGDLNTQDGSPTEQIFASRPHQAYRNFLAKHTNGCTSRSEASTSRNALRCTAHRRSSSAFHSTSSVERKANFERPTFTIATGSRQPYNVSRAPTGRDEDFISEHLTLSPCDIESPSFSETASLTSSVFQRQNSFGSPDAQPNASSQHVVRPGIPSPDLWTTTNRNRGHFSARSCLSHHNTSSAYPSPPNVNTQMSSTHPNIDVATVIGSPTLFNSPANTLDDSPSPILTGIFGPCKQSPRSPRAITIDHSIGPKFDGQVPADGNSWIHRLHSVLSDRPDSHEHLKSMASRNPPSHSVPNYMTPGFVRNNMDDRSR